MTKMERICIIPTLFIYLSLVCSSSSGSKEIYYCPEDFIQITSSLLLPQNSNFHQLVNKCYHFIQENVSFVEASKRCNNLNSVLASPENENEIMAISDYVVKKLNTSYSHYWISVSNDLINSTNPYDKAYVNNSKALENIIRSLETNETTKEKASCQNMLVWVIGKQNIQWINKVCGKKAFPLCEVKAQVRMETFSSIVPTTVSSGQNDIELSTNQFETNTKDKVIKQPTSKRECSLQCSSHTLRVACELKYFPEAVNKTVVLLDANCISRSNGTHLIIHTGLDDCGTTAENSAEDKVIYKNALRILEDQKKPLELIEITCRYPQRNFITQSFGAGDDDENNQETNNDKSISKISPFSTSKEGSSFRHILLIYPSIDYECPIQPDEYPVTFNVNDRLFAEIRVIVPSEQIELHPVECFATETKEFTSTTARYTLLHNGCYEDKSFRFEDSTSPKISRISFDLKGIFQLFNEMYIHCEIILCALNSPDSQTCNYECSLKSKRDTQKLLRNLVHVRSDRIKIVADSQYDQNLLEKSQKQKNDDLNNIQKVTRFESSRKNYSESFTVKSRKAVDSVVERVKATPLKSNIENHKAEKLSVSFLYILIY